VRAVIGRASCRKEWKYRVDLGGGRIIKKKKANTIGVPFQVIGPQQVRELWPLIELGDGAGTPKLIGAL